MKVNIGFHSQLIEPYKQPFQIEESPQGVGVVQDWFGKWLSGTNLIDVLLIRVPLGC